MTTSYGYWFNTQQVLSPGDLRVAPLDLHCAAATRDAARVRLLAWYVLEAVPRAADEKIANAAIFGANVKQDAVRSL